MVTLYTVFSFKTRQTMMNLIQPVLLHVSRQIALLYMRESRTGPSQGRFHIPALMLIIFCHLDMSIDMPIRCSLFPQPDGFVKVAASFLQDGQTLHCQGEICFRYPRLESMLEQARGFLPATEILKQLAERDKVQSMLHMSAIWVFHHVIDVRQQGCHGNHIHRIVIEHARQRTRIT